MNFGSTLRLDFDIINQTSCKFLTILDTSDYIVAPENPSFDVQIPGYDSAIRLSYDPGQLNLYNSGLLGLSGNTITNLPDGVYTLTYRICPLDVLYITKKIIRTCVIECKYLNLYSKYNTECSDGNEDFNKKLVKIKNYIESAKANGSICNYLKAAEFIQRANDLLLEVDCNC